MKPGSYKRNYAVVAEQLRKLSPVPATTDPYSTFDEIDGSHPWKQALPNGYIEYEARILRKSRVVYFNFALAKEMGLIPPEHPHKLNAKLEKKLIETFSLRILNEYDILNGVKFPKKDIKPNKYMATRYLQLQHNCRMGTTSGDGRSIWNGYFERGGVAWDVSSCGTGVTRLSPGAAESGKPIRTGDQKVSYGSGLADVDEGISAAILSESFHNRGIFTERTLLVVEGPQKGSSVNVRAAKNLLRPSHLFLHLKQGNYASVKAALDHFIARQINNRDWRGSLAQDAIYDEFLNQIVENYARFTAQLEDEYIFCWLDWDGDNMLTSGGIIDYGSIRQFGLCHHHYRYDDVQRYSTNLREQKGKARQLLQTFAQLVDFIKTGKKQELGKYIAHPSLVKFDNCFQHEKERLLLRRMGLSPEQRKRLTEECRDLLERFMRIYHYFERKELGRGLKETADGVNDPAVYDVHYLLRELPQQLLDRKEISSRDFLEMMETPFTTKALLKATPPQKISEFLSVYSEIIQFLAEKKSSARKVLLEMTMRASVANRLDFITGDGIILAVEELLKIRRRVKKDDFMRLVDCLIDHQTGRNSVVLRGRLKKYFYKILDIIAATRHSI